MSDNITLPRKVAKLALDHIEWYIENERGGRFAEVREAAEALRTALAAPRPEPKPEPVARACPWCNGTGSLRDIDTGGLLPCVCKPKEDKT